MTTLQLLNLLNFYLGKFSGDTSDEKTQKIRALNIAKDFIIPQLGLPSSERTYSFVFVEDKEKYVLSSDFIEPISIYYDESLGNVYKTANRNTEFVYQYPEKLEKINKHSGIVYWGIDYANNIKKIFIQAPNIRKGFTIDDCDSLTGWQGLNDATELTLDTTRYVKGSGSIQFKIDETVSGNARATLKFTPSSSLDLSSYQNKSYFYLNLYVDDPTGVTGITLKWGTDSSNYWSKTETQNADGDNLKADSWNEFLFSWENATAVGSPDAKSITFFQVDIDYNEAQFASPQYWNIDSLQLFSFDRFVLRYYSHNVVQDGTTGNPKKDLENDNDIALFAQYDPSLGEFVALYAAHLYEGFVNKNLEGTQELLKLYNEKLVGDYVIRYPKRTPIYFRGEISVPPTRF